MAKYASVRETERQKERDRQRERERERERECLVQPEASSYGMCS